jgi:hypothetical protein
LRRLGIDPISKPCWVDLDVDPSGPPLVRGADTLEGAPGLYFIGISVQLAGLLREIGREAHRP